MKRVALFILLLFAGYGVYAQNFTVNIDGFERNYIMHLPDNLQKNAPFVFVLHGYGATAEQVLDKGFNEAANKYGFAVCYPLGSKDGRGNHCWNVGYPFQEDMIVDDISFLCKLAAKLQKEYGLSKKKTFLTGMSNGGEMCYLLAYSNQKTFAAVAPIAGLTMAWMPQKLTPKRKIPLFEIHGTQDRVSEWEGDLLNKGGWGAYISVPDAVKFWVDFNGCTTESVEQIHLGEPQPGGSGATKMVKHKFVGKKNSPQVWLYEMVGGGHSWFNYDFNIAEQVWEFFDML